jgi:hypothetical protein
MGRPPLGEAAMSAADRQRRRRAKLRDEGHVTKPETKPGAGEVAASDSDTVILSKLMGTLGLERLRAFARALPRLLAGQRAETKAEKKGYSLADNERFAPGGMVKWYEPHPRWHRLRSPIKNPAYGRGLRQC